MFTLRNLKLEINSFINPKLIGRPLRVTLCASSCFSLLFWISLLFIPWIMCKLECLIVVLCVHFLLCPEIKIIKKVTLGSCHLLMLRGKIKEGALFFCSVAFIFFLFKIYSRSLKYRINFFCKICTALWCFRSERKLFVCIRISRLPQLSIFLLRNSFICFLSSLSRMAWIGRVLDHLSCSPFNKLLFALISQRSLFAAGSILKKAFILSFWNYWWRYHQARNWVKGRHDPDTSRGSCCRSRHWVLCTVIFWRILSDILAVYV